MNAPLLTQPLKVALIGLDTRAHASLDMFLRGPARGVCELVGEEMAEVTIVDLDGHDGESLWRAFRERCPGTALVMSLREQHLHNAVWVRKPLNPKDFLEAIELIRQRLHTERLIHEYEVSVELPELDETGDPEAEPLAQPVVAAVAGVDAANQGVSRAARLAWNERQAHECCGALEDAVYSDPARRAELFYQPEDYFQGLLQRSCRQAQDTARPVRLEVMGQAMIVLPERRQVFSEIREPVLRPLCVAPIRSLPGGGLRSPDTYPSGALPTLPTGPDSRLYSYEKMLWLLALWASRGRVPKGTDLDAPVMLARWPNFSRLLITPHALQMAAIWSHRPLSLLQTARQLAIPHRYVFAFYSACRAIGLIEQRGPVPAMPATEALPPPAPKQKRGLLGSLLRKLKLTR